MYTVGYYNDTKTSAPSTPTARTPLTLTTSSLTTTNTSWCVYHLPGDRPQFLAGLRYCNR